MALPCCSLQRPSLLLCFAPSSSPSAMALRRPSPGPVKPRHRLVALLDPDLAGFARLLASSPVARELAVAPFPDLHHPASSASPAVLCLAPRPPSASSPWPPRLPLQDQAASHVLLVKPRSPSARGEELLEHLRPHPLVPSILVGVRRSPSTSRLTREHHHLQRAAVPPPPGDLLHPPTAALPATSSSSPPRAVPADSDQGAPPLA
nr:proline-rich receptor-like protein kinase PERK14 [Aegilops tauschii subsp. strangulata]